VIKKKGNERKRETDVAKRSVEWSTDYGKERQPRKKKKLEISLKKKKHRRRGTRVSLK